VSWIRFTIDSGLQNWLLNTCKRPRVMKIRNHNGFIIVGALCEFLANLAEWKNIANQILIQSFSILGGHYVEKRLIHRNLRKILLFVIVKLNSAKETTFLSSPKRILKFYKFFEFWNSSAHFGVYDERNHKTFDDIH